MTPLVKLILVGTLSAVATAGAGAVALTAMDNGLGPMGRADANNDGRVTRGEWLQAANARFLKDDANHDGVLASGELPRPPRPPRHGPGHHHHGCDGPDDAPQAAPAAVPAPATAPATGNVTTAS